MARQNVRVDPSVREFEAFLDFSGGLNTEVSNEKLKNNEFPVISNVDLTGRGSARRRTGRTKLLTVAGVAQGAFFFYKKNATAPDLLEAIGGKLYFGTSQITITDGGSPWTFQATLPVEAVQYRDVLYIATGTKLVQVTNPTGTAYVAVTVTPYTPSVLEAIYIGTNALASNPDAYVQDGVSPTLQVVGIKPTAQSAAVNVAMTMTAYISKPAGMASVDYKWEYKKNVETSWTMGQDWTTGTPGKTYNFTGTEATGYDIRVSVRDTSTPTTTNQYLLANFKVEQLDENRNTSLDVSGIGLCRKILLHWDRIILAGDPTNPFQVYVSDLENPIYFPMGNTINFDTGKREAVTTMIRFQDMLVIFTKTTIQTLIGKSPEDYKRFLIHDGIGCIADRSAMVVGNVILFKSYEGVHSLKPNPYRLETMNVSRVDVQIRSEVPSDNNACAMVFANQYWLCFPDKKVIYRFYYELGIWVKDASDKLDIVQFLRYGDDVYNLSKNGNVYKHDETVYTDDSYVYIMDVESKFLDLSASFNMKKLKSLHLLAKHFSENVELYVSVQADSSLILTPMSGQAVITAQDTVIWQVTETPNIELLAGTAFGSWILGESPFGTVELSAQELRVRGKAYRFKVKFQHKQDSPCEVYGFGLEFKVKRL